MNNLLTFKNSIDFLKPIYYNKDTKRKRERKRQFKMEFGIYVSNNLVFSVGGVKASFEVWKRTKEAAEMCSTYACLVDLRTGEVLAETEE